MKLTMRFLAIALFTIGLVGTGKTESMAAGSEDGSIQGKRHEEADKKIGGMIMLGERIVGGVMAMPHLQDITAARSRIGKRETHRFLVVLVDKATGMPIINCAVALRIRRPLGQEGEAVWLTAFEGYFGADITLVEKGAYTFILGTEVEGGEVRQFEFIHEIK